MEENFHTIRKSPKTRWNGVDLGAAPEGATATGAANHVLSGVPTADSEPVIGRTCLVKDGSVFFQDFSFHKIDSFEGKTFTFTGKINGSYVLVSEGCGGKLDYGKGSIFIKPDCVIFLPPAQPDQSGT